MSATVVEEKSITKKGTGPVTKETYEHRIHADWCPGCGDFSVLAALQAALGELGLEPYNTVVVSGIGCSSNLPGYINCYGMHTLHGRSLAVASGVKMANHSLNVIATGGDGDGYGIGNNHLVHCMRRNIDITYIVMDNQIYGLTTGQCSPTSARGAKTKTTPNGNIENPYNPIAMAITGGATYVARGYSAKPKHLIELIKAGIQHKGFSLIDVFSPCVTFNKENTYQWFNKRVKMLEESGHNPTDFHTAMDRAYEFTDDEGVPIGLFWKRDDLGSLDQLDPVCADGPVATRPTGLSKEQQAQLLKEIM
ncbi:MAG: 2-oxoacid:ferredoxin oxidoreductase subunit beta [Verrucomicrobiae bacterium]|nr:2-oxoacid:ferredoxin oxidoreductase subunit beta [Verrucomicrobiae bacterium]